MANVVQIGRLNYVEPNIDENGNDFPVKLEDLSIYVDLTVDVKSRFEDTSQDVLYKISWLVDETNSASFLAGKKLNASSDETVLTTYYTEITYNDGKNGMIVEGLGMTSINIDYDSWYMPYITINFSDVRGISVFTPNEYENDNSEQGQILANGFFKCFMTFPYPKFTLTVKGFYGEPVVYHLNCIDFKTRFNSTTGNFESTAKFIGYNYAFLSDIEFNYLKIAPFDTYEGKKYFETQNNNNAKWRVDGQPIPTLVDLEQTIAKAIGVLSELKQDDKKIRRLYELSDEYGRANAVKTALLDFFTFLKQETNATIVETSGNDQRLFCFTSAPLRFYDDNPEQGYLILTDKVREQWIKLCSLIFNYNDKTPKKKLKYLNNIDNQDASDTGSTANKVPERLKLTEMFDGKGAIIAGNNGIADNLMKLKGFNVNDVMINDNMAKTIYDSNLAKPLPPYVYLFDINGIVKECDEVMNGITNERRELLQYMETFIREQTIDLLGFMPTIGNICKIIFAHLETFIHSVYTCMNRARTRDRINGFNVAYSDIAVAGGRSNIPPFPAFRVEDKKHKGMWVDSWMGNHDTTQPEVQLIYGLNRAVEKVREEDQALDEKLTTANNTNPYEPVFPMDTSLGINPFNEKMVNRDYNVGKFLSHVALRGMKVCNIAKSNKYVSDLAKVDAFNFYYANTDEKTKLRDILDKISGENGGGSYASTQIVNYVKHNNDKLATNSNKTDKYIYEFDLVTTQTMIEDDGSNYTNSFLVYNGNDILPNSLKDFTGAYNSYVNEYIANGQITLPGALKEDNTIFYTNSDSVVVNEKGWEETYTSNSRFNIITDGNWINEIEQFTEENIKVENGTRTTNHITIQDLKQEIPSDTLLCSEIWKTDDDSLLDWYITDKNIFATNVELTKYNSYTIVDKLLTDEQIEEINEKETGKTDTMTKDINIIAGAVEDTLEYKGNIKDYIDGNIYLASFHDRKNRYTLFGTPFYYMQNENDFEQEDITKTKAYIFLQFLDFNTSKLKEIFQINADYGCKIEKLPYIVVLFIGSILWRKKFIDENGKDPVKYKSEEFTQFTYQKPYAEDADKIYDKLLGCSTYKSMRPEIIVKKRTDKDIWYVGWSVEELFGNDMIYKLDYSLHNRFLKEFENWALNNSSGFVCIKNAYELTDKKNNKAYTSKTFFELIDDYYKEANKSYKWWINPAKNIEEGEFENRFAKMKFIRDNMSTNLKNYNCFVIGNKETASGSGDSLYLYNNLSTNACRAITDLYKKKCIMIFTNPYIEKDNTNRVTFNKGIYENYLATFVDTLKQLLTNANSNVQANPNTEQPIDTVSYDDMYNAMYLYLKKIHDAWFIGKGENEFSMENLYEGSFVFVDSFYNDITDDLIINCEWLLNRLRQNEKSCSLYKFLADMFAQHGCLFLAIPNFINWNDKDAVSHMLDPVVIKDMNRDDTNKFVVMYAHEPSRNLNMNKDKSGKYAFSEDGFMIYDPALKENTKLIPQLQESNDKSYKIPSIGVAFAKQNQSYFKSIQVGMDNPVTTEAAINAMYQIAEKGGNGSETKGSFWGQDLYRVWSNYSYTCSFEMLGCAQIQPLMYFQLLNIPLFRGTYMVSKINHEITPNHMVTKVQGYKMCRYGKPFVTEAFGFFNLILKETQSLTGSSVIDQENYNPASATRHYDNNITKEIKDTYTDTYNPDTVNWDDDDCVCAGDGANYADTCPSIKKLFRALSETIKVNYNGEWGICVSSGKRDGSGTSDHNYGRAIDILITDKNGNKTSNKSKLPIVFDILLQCYSDRIRQLIWETKDINGCTAEAPDHLIHVSVNYDASDGEVPAGKATPKFQVFQAYNAGANTARGEDCLSPTFLTSIAKKFNNDKYTNNQIKQIVLSLADDPDPKKTLSKYYGGSTDNSNTSNSANSLMLINAVKNMGDAKTFEDNIKNIGQSYGFDPNWIMFWAYSESQLNPAAHGGGSGLIQWTSYGASACGTTESALLGMTASEQSEYIKKYFAAANVRSGQIKNITDVKLLGFSPSDFVAGKFKSADSVVFEQGSAAWNANHTPYIGSEKRDVLVSDIQKHFFNNIKMAAQASGLTNKLDTILVGY